MKKLFAVTAFALLFFSCADNKKQEKALQDEVIAIHDSVMAKEELVMKAKIDLDTLVKKAIIPAPDTLAATKLITILDSADAKMEDWMHKFDVENTGKSHDEIMHYLEGQKRQIKSINAQFDAAIAATNNYKKSLKK